MRAINEKEAFFIGQFTISEGIDQWEEIKKSCTSAVIKENPEINYLRFPGLTLTTHGDYLCYIMSRSFFYPFSKSSLIYPRGNITQNSKYAFIGIRPGPGSPKYEAGTSWLFGPSSRILHKLLYDLDIYPYFTNIYKYPDIQDRKFFIDSFIQEILTVNHICDKITLVFMGNYDEYEEVIDRLDGKIDHIKIWHPSYLLRAYSDKKYNIWKEQLIGNNNYRG